MNCRSMLLGGALGLLPVFLFCQIPYQSGWPVEIQAPTGRPIYIADIDNDGIKELIMMSIGSNYQEAMLYLFKNDGGIMSGFPIAGGHFFNGNPSLVDIDDDGKLEIIITYDGGLHLLDFEGNTIWSEPYTGSVFQSTYYPYHVSIDDLDNDGIPEIIVTCYSGGAVFVFEPDGSVRPGWPVLAENSFTSASIGDIDNDGSKEIITLGTKIWCFKPDGSVCQGFPIFYSTSGSRTQPVLVDVDNDGYLEILFGWEDSKIRMLRYDGSLYPCYPLNYYGGNMSIGDVNQDGYLEFFFARTMAQGIWGFDALNAELLPGYPFVDSLGEFGFSFKAPSLVDLSNDSGLEIAAGAGSLNLISDGKLFAFNQDGNIVQGFPSDVLYHRALKTGCAINDLDGDGDIEICCGSENEEYVSIRHSTVYCWDVPYPYNLDNIDWAMDGFDLGHTGRWRKLYHIDKINSSLEVPGCSTSPCLLPSDGSLYDVIVTATRQADGSHPSGQDVRYSRTLGCGNYEGPVVDNGDGSYTRKFRAPTTPCQAELHAWVNEFKLQDYALIQFVPTCSDDLGDVDMDSGISSFDASLVLQQVVQLTSLTPDQLCRANTDEDTMITAYDASLILQCTVSLCTHLPPDMLTSCQSHGLCP